MRSLVRILGGGGATPFAGGDDVREFDTLAAFPEAGEAGVLYVAANTRKAYSWRGTTYIEVSPLEVHSHAISDVTGLQGAIDAKAAASHVHVIGDVTGLQGELDGKAASDHGHAYPVTSVNGQTGDVAIAVGAELSGLTPLPLGAASPGSGSTASRHDHVHAMPSASDVGALGADSAIDGGYYSGAIVTQDPEIQITNNPADTTVTAQPSATWSASEVTAGQPTSAPVSRSLMSDGTTALFLNGGPVPSQKGVWSTSNAGQTWSLSARTWADANMDPSAMIAGYGNGKWVAVDTRSLRSYTATQSPSQADAWTVTSGNGFPHGGSDDLPIGGQRRIVFGGGVFLAGSKPSSFSWADGLGRVIGTWYKNQLMRSVDGQSWTASTPPSGADGLVEALAFDQASSRFVMASTSWNVASGAVRYHIYYSDDAINWTAATVPAFSSGGQFVWNRRSVAAFGGGRFVVKPNHHISDVFVSPNGVSWSKHAGPGFVCNDLLHDGAFFVAIGSGVYATSSDGLTWVSRPTASANWWSAALVGAKTIARAETHTPTSTLVIERTVTSSAASASFSVSAYIPTGTLSYQWQKSVNAGASWSAIQSATSPTLVLSGLTAGDSGTMYRAIVSAPGMASATSLPATLTVN